MWYLFVLALTFQHANAEDNGENILGEVTGVSTNFKVKSLRLEVGLWTSMFCDISYYGRLIVSTDISNRTWIVKIPVSFEKHFIPHQILKETLYFYLDGKDFSLYKHVILADGENSILTKVFGINDQFNVNVTTDSLFLNIQGILTHMPVYIFRFVSYKSGIVSCQRFVVNSIEHKKLSDVYVFFWNINGIVMDINSRAFVNKTGNITVLEKLDHDDCMTRVILRCDKWLSRDLKNITYMYTMKKEKMFNSSCLLNNYAQSASICVLFDLIKNRPLEKLTLNVTSFANMCKNSITDSDFRCGVSFPIQSDGYVINIISSLGSQIHIFSSVYMKESLDKVWSGSFYPLSIKIDPGATLLVYISVYDKNSLVEEGYWNIKTIKGNIRFIRAHSILPNVNMTLGTHGEFTLYALKEYTYVVSLMSDYVKEKYNFVRH
ncbi:F17 [Felid gammaherpesvirus 1]|uniref:F17 n=1 Tax=Felid gammaherpesvirus 1 TaxID=2560468 RepID=A0A0M5L1U4_9GAMA|nr:F17 [Felis catus gammaherpesvirus 1]ALE14739.1 F17 [Felis catus gammaherpesvirus 1]